jgi:pilus assembly protein CpaF
MLTVDKPGVRPIRHLLLDPQVTEIMINGPNQLFVEKGGKMIQIPSVFQAPGQMEVLLDNLLSLTGRAITAKAPMVDFRLEDGSRVNVVIPPVALGGAIITIRKFTRSLRSIDDLIAKGTLTDGMANFLAYAVRARLNIIYAGGTGTGKTTTLGLLCNYIAEGERVIVIEDTAELDLPLPHCVRMECRPPNIEGSGSIQLGELLKNSLRMRPTRILVGEIRGEEAFEMMHAMSRLELMLLSRGLPLPLWAIQKQISASVDLVIQHSIGQDGVRRITNITEVGEVVNDQVQLHDIFAYHLEGFTSDGRAVGSFVAGNRKPKFYDRLKLIAGKRIDELFVEPPVPPPPPSRGR